MKKLLKYQVTVVLAAGWLLMSVFGYLGKDSIYKNYILDARKTPYFVLVLEGIHDNIYPWSKEPSDIWNHGGTGLPEKPETVCATDTESAVDEKPPKDADSQSGKTAVRNFTQVDDSYFEDAVFIGDSRTVGLHDYGGLDHTDFFATVGLNVYDMWTEKFCEVNGQKVTLEEALSAKQYKKLYFQIGINEMGRGTLDGFMEAYAQSVEKFKSLQPDAIIYVQGIMKVTAAKSDKDPIFNNAGIESRNERIAQLADQSRIFYIDVNEAVCDESGNLRADLTFDNLHLYGSKYDIWVNFLKTKGITE